MLKINKIALLLLIGVALADVDEDVADKLDAVLVTGGLMDGKPCTATN
jgi:hypothetical protein